jgi:hypothetical protein
MHLGTRFGTRDVEQVRAALNRVGFELRQTEPKPVFSTKVSKPMREYVWSFADLRAKKKR